MSEDLNNNGELDTALVESDLNGDKILQPNEDFNKNGVLDEGTINEDANGNGALDIPDRVRRSDSFDGRQNRIVATLIFLRERSSRYKASAAPDTALQSSANSPRLRLKKNIYCIVLASRNAPKIACSTGVEVERPIYRPPLRSVNSRSARL